jgi:hypothetical protein
MVVPKRVSSFHARPLDVPRGIVNSLSYSQSQSINSLYLSTVPGPTPTDPDRRKFVDRKTDFVLSYSHRDPTVASLYKKLGTSNCVSIGHTLDAFTKRTALFSGFEVKAASGSHTEAELQMSIWMAASLRKKQELVQLAQINSASVTLIEPALTIVGHEHSVYYAFPRENPLAGRGGVHILGPDSDRFERLSTNSVRGIFRLLRFYGNMLEYGMDDRVDGYWGGTLKPVLEKLAATYLEAES